MEILKNNIKHMINDINIDIKITANLMYR